jgi:YesN/AraC family two-component response regulator
MKDTSSPLRRDIDRIVIAKGKRGYYSPLQADHSHVFFEIFYIYSGECSFLLKDTVYRLNRGDLVFIVPGELHHSIYNDGDTCEIVNVLFKKSHVNMDSFSEPSSFMGSIPDLYIEEFHNLLSKMYSEYSHIDKYSEDFMQCYLSELLLLLMRHSVMNEEEPEILNSKDADILAATKYIYQNFRRPLTLEEVSAVSSLSPTYFSKKFKQTTGMGFKEYLNFVRLKHAQAALLTTNNTITDIALEYGFNNSNYFKDLFKKVYGKSPREYRKAPD